MVHRKVRQRDTRKGPGSHNRSWIWGRHVVAETLRAGTWPILRLAVSGKLEAKARTDLLRLAERRSIPLEECDDAGVTRLCRAADHQGCAAMMGEFPYLDGEDFLRRQSPESRVLILDRIQDPFNFGAMIRTAECLGLAGVVIGTAEQTGVNSQVARSSAGAVNHVPIARVDDLPSFVSVLSRQGWHIWGATERGQVALRQADFRPPLALIIGNEGSGLRPELMRQCTQTVRIPMAGRVGSLNAAVSAGILCYAATNLASGPELNPTDVIAPAESA